MENPRGNAAGWNLEGGGGMKGWRRASLPAPKGGVLATLGVTGWGTCRLQKQQLALLFQEKKIVLQWNQSAFPPLKLGANACRKCAFNTVRQLTTPRYSPPPGEGAGNRHGRGLTRGLTRGSTATRWPCPQLLGHFSEGAGTQLLPPTVQGCRSRGARAPLWPLSPQSLRGVPFLCYS